MATPSRNPDDPRPIADASSLFDTGPIPIVPSPPPSVEPPGEPDLGTDEIRVVDWAAPPEPEPEPERPMAEIPYEEEVDGYGLVGGPAEAIDAPPPEPVALPTPEKKVRRRPADPDAGPAELEVEAPRRRRKGAEIQTDEDAEAYPLWSRWAEWGGTLVIVGSVVLGTLFLAFLIAKAGFWGFAFLLTMAGFAAAVLLSYPIVVTMERPVRVTPEQAVKDFYAAASHHFPHYKRMWLLLSSAGREAVPSGSFAAFRSEWERRVATWKGDRIKKFAPLDFQVQDFRADKSVGQTTIWAEYTLRVRPRDQKSAEPLASIRMSHGLVKGDDRMWYLNRGLPASSDG